MSVPLDPTLTACDDEGLSQPRYAKQKDKAYDRVCNDFTGDIHCRPIRTVSMTMRP